MSMATPLVLVLLPPSLAGKFCPPRVKNGTTTWHTTLETYQDLICLSVGTCRQTTPNVLCLESFFIYFLFLLPHSWPFYSSGTARIIILAAASAGSLQPLLFTSAGGVPSSSWASHPPMLADWVIFPGLYLACLFVSQMYVC